MFCLVSTPSGMFAAANGSQVAGAARDAEASLRASHLRSMSPCAFSFRIRFGCDIADPLGPLSVFHLPSHSSKPKPQDSPTGSGFNLFNATRKNSYSVS